MLWWRHADELRDRQHVQRENRERTNQEYTTRQFDGQPDVDRRARYEKPIQQKIRARIAVKIHRLQKGRQKRINREARNDETHEERAIENLCGGSEPV